MTVIKTPAGIMLDLFECGFAFDIHSGHDSISLRGTATVTLDDQGAPIRVVWERDD